MPHAVCATLVTVMILGLAPGQPGVPAARAAIADSDNRLEPPPRPRRRPRSPMAPRRAETPPEPETKEEKKKDEPDTWVAIAGGDVHTVTQGVHRGATILIKNGRIHRIGESVEVPEKARRIDAKGLRVYPGLVMLESRGIVGRPPVEDTTNPFSLNMLLALSAGVTTVVSSNTACKLTYGSVDEMTLVENPWIPLQYTTRNPKGRKTLRDDFDRVKRYLREKREYDAAKKRGEEGIEEPDGKFVQSGKYANYKKLLTGESVAFFNRVEAAADLLGIAELCRDYGIRAVLRGATAGWAVAPELGRSGIQVVITPRSRRPQIRRSNRPSGSTIENARILHDHGVPLAIVPQSSGISLGGQVGRDLLTAPMEAAYAVRGGLPADAAVAAITIEPARMLGVDDRIGSIEVGKDADLILCDGDLLHYETLVQLALVDGEVVYDKEKESLFRHVRPREGPEEIDNLWPRRFLEELLRGTGPSSSER